MIAKISKLVLTLGAYRLGWLNLYYLQRFKYKCIQEIISDIMESQPLQCYLIIYLENVIQNLVHFSTAPQQRASKKILNKIPEEGSLILFPFGMLIGGKFFGKIKIPLHNVFISANIYLIVVALNICSSFLSVFKRTKLVSLKLISQVFEILIRPIFAWSLRRLYEKLQHYFNVLLCF